MDLAAEFSSFHEGVISKLIQTTRTVGQISSEDIGFHRTSSSEFAESLDEQRARLLSLTSSLLKAATAGSDLKAPVLQDEDSVEDNWRGVVDVIDNLLEKADACLDEFTGIIKKLSPSHQAQGRGTPSRQETSKTLPSIYDNGPSRIPKPQLQFHHTPDNTIVSPFRPLLKSKPHAIVPLEKSLQMVESESERSFFSNPYEAEIRAANYPPSAYVTSPPIQYGSFESTKATWVDTLEGVSEMLAELKDAKEIAIDLEHHDVHSYHGLVSLMQISTRDRDWVIDTLQPWREELQQLNEVFADPSILKVLHGSRMDIIWLQRDLGLYVVGMFDTYHAAVALGYPQRSLKFLLDKFVNFTANKKYQMADWRVRPLEEEMFNYARADTHYLLYIYDHLRNELLENSEPGNSLVDYVLEQSKTEALQRYDRPVYDPVHGQGAGGWYDVLTRNSTVLSKEQFAVFKAVHQWRDEVARAEDEGVQCVFPKNVLFKVAMTMPLDKYTLFKTMSPVTLIVKNRVSELLDVIKNAKLAGATGPELRDIVIPRKFTAGAPPGTTTISQPQHIPVVGNDIVSSPAVRAESSQFWGSALQANGTVAVPAAFKVAASLEALRLSLPIPPMPMTVSEVSEKLKTAPSTTSLQHIPPVSTPVETKTDDIFTIKDIASRRKRKITEESEVSSASSEDGSDEESSEADSSEDEQPAKKPRQAIVNKNSVPVQESTPFDYSNAPSVLHAKPDPATVAGGAASDKHRKPFNPYAKALNAPSGMRKSRKDTAGKAFTFRK